MASKKRYYNKQAKVNLTEKGFEKLTLLAEKEDLTKGEFLRKLFDEQTENAQLPQKKEVEIIHKIDKEFFRQYCGIANNINQIARRLNSDHVLELGLLQVVESKIDLLLECAKK